MEKCRQKNILSRLALRHDIFPQLEVSRKVSNFPTVFWSVTLVEKNWISNLMVHFRNVFREPYQTSKMEIFAEKAPSEKLDRVLNTSLHFKLRKDYWKATRKFVKFLLCPIKLFSVENIRQNLENTIDDLNWKEKHRGVFLLCFV